MANKSKSRRTWMIGLALLVLVLLGVLGYPQWKMYQERERRVLAGSQMHNLHLACTAYWAENGGEHECGEPIVAGPKYKYRPSPEVIVVACGNEATFEMQGKYHDHPEIKLADEPGHLLGCRSWDLDIRAADELLYTSIQNKNLTDIKNALTKGARLNYEGAWVVKNRVDSISPLNFAVWQKNQEAVEFLVENGADINFISSIYLVRNFNWSIFAVYMDPAVGSSLHSALAIEHLELTQWLLAHGADPEVPAVHTYHFGGPAEFYQLYPLHFAVMNNNPDLVRLLLEHGADPDTVPTGHNSTSLTPMKDNYIPLQLAKIMLARLPEGDSNVKKKMETIVTLLEDAE